MLLAQRGQNVLCIDKASYGSDTLSTHALMRSGVAKLSRWGLLDRVFEAATPTITSTVFQYGDDRLDLEVAPAPGMPGLAAPRRTVLDPILVDAARESGAHVLHETRLVDIIKNQQDRVVGVEIELAGGARKVVCTDLLIGADGLRSTVAKQLEVPVTRQGNNAMAYAFKYVQGADINRHAFQFLYRPGIGAGVIPTNGDATCVFVAVRPEFFKAEGRKDVSAMWSTVLKALDPTIAEAVELGTPISPMRSFPGVPGRFKKAFGPGWALVGDAGYFKDPFGAHGISDAFRDAELLADAAISGDFAGYEKVRDELSLPLFDVLEQIAGAEWDLPTLQGLHYQLSMTMKAEGKAIKAYERELAQDRG
jgi:2-polyprenyl-6-methoxyphenol hydroxylase-like FAD-dependent oxidoreductase